MSQRYLISITIICWALLGCAHRSIPVAKPNIPLTEVDCVARGGSWTTLGIPMPDKPKMCDLKTTDSAKACTDSSECQGICMAPGSAQAGDRVRGACSAYVSNFGTFLEVVKGSAVELNVE